jgi:hypothetical protein
MELFPDLARNCPRPACPDLAHVDQVFPFPLSKVESSDAGWIFHKSDHREFAFLNGFDLLQPSLRSDR